MVRREHSILHFLSKLQIFIPTKLEELEGMDLGLMKFLLEPLNTPLILALFSHSIVKKIQLSFLHVIARSLQSEATTASLSFSSVCYNFRLLLKPSMSFFFFYFVCQSLGVSFKQLWGPQMKQFHKNQLFASHLSFKSYENFLPVILFTIYQKPKSQNAFKSTRCASALLFFESYLEA